MNNRSAASRIAQGVLALEQVFLLEGLEPPAYIVLKDAKQGDILEAALRVYCTHPSVLQTTGKTLLGHVKIAGIGIVWDLDRDGGYLP